MASKRLQDKVIMNEEIELRLGTIKEIGSDLKFEEALFNKLKSKGYDWYDKFRYKIVLEYKKE